MKQLRNVLILRKCEVFNRLIPCLQFKAVFPTPSLNAIRPSLLFLSLSLFLPNAPMPLALIRSLRFSTVLSGGRLMRGTPHARAPCPPP